jgi:hypothetical protein
VTAGQFAATLYHITLEILPGLLLGLQSHVTDFAMSPTMVLEEQEAKWTHVQCLLCCLFHHWLGGMSQVQLRIPLDGNKGVGSLHRGSSYLLRPSAPVLDH